MKEHVSLATSHERFRNKYHLSCLERTNASCIKQLAWHGRVTRLGATSTNTHTYHVVENTDIHTRTAYSASRDACMVFVVPSYQVDK